jgi:malonate-semialdehyde dehydrogenase (acetylating)/methylmalonate-semialdehyde dehydrogenase
MAIAKEEVFGPVLNVMRFEDLDSAIERRTRSAFGNGACIYTSPARPRASSVTASRPAWSASTSACPRRWPMFPFSGWDYSFFGDLHLQGREGVHVLHPPEGRLVPLVRRRRGRCLAEVANE